MNEPIVALKTDDDDDDDFSQSSLIIEEIYTDETTISSTTTTTTTTTTNYVGLNIIFSRMAQCIDIRDDCLLQKQYGFCRILNEKYPYDCMKTCHPSCVSH